MVSNSKNVMLGQTMVDFVGMTQTGFGQLPQQQGQQSAMQPGTLSADGDFIHFQNRALHYLVVFIKSVH